MSNVYILRRDGPAGPERYVFAGDYGQLIDRVKWSQSPHYDFLRGPHEIEINVRPFEPPTYTPLLRLSFQHFGTSVVNRLPPRKPQPVSMYDTSGVLLDNYSSLRHLQREQPWLGQFLWTVNVLAWSAWQLHGRVILWT